MATAAPAAPPTAHPRRASRRAPPAPNQRSAGAAAPRPRASVHPPRTRPRPARRRPRPRGCRRLLLQAWLCRGPPVPPAAPLPAQQTGASRCLSLRRFQALGLTPLSAQLPHFVLPTNEPQPLSTPRGCAHAWVAPAAFSNSPPAQNTANACFVLWNLIFLLTSLSIRFVYHTA